jgi:gp16 family phage-associated protein
MTKAQANQIKQRLREEGMTLGAWAIANNFKYRDVSDVVRGVRRGYYGIGRTIAVKLGIDPDAEDQMAA